MRCTLPGAAPRATSRVRVTTCTLVPVPTKRTFDLIVVTGILLLPSFGLLRVAAKRWKRESTGIKGEVGEAVELVIGK